MKSIFSLKSLRVDKIIHSVISIIYLSSSLAHEKFAVFFFVIVAESHLIYLIEIRKILLRGILICMFHKIIVHISWYHTKFEFSSSSSLLYKFIPSIFFLLSFSSSSIHSSNLPRTNLQSTTVLSSSLSLST